VKSLLKSTMGIIALVGALILVSEIVLVGVLFAAGVVTETRIDDAIKVFRGELATPPSADQQAAEPEPLEINTEQELRQAVARWREEKAVEQERLRTQEEAVASMLRELSAVRIAIDSRQRALETRESAFEAQLAARAAAEKDEGFQAAVGLYGKMEAKDVAELLYGLDDAEVLRYLKVFKASFAAEILTELKKVDEEKNPVLPDTVRLNRAALLQQMLSNPQPSDNNNAADVAALR